jgi:hypothetical protein
LASAILLNVVAPTCSCCGLKINTIDIFKFLQEFDFEPVDNCINSVLGQDVELTDEFKANYEVWLHKEVYNMEIEWDLVLDCAAGNSI